MKRPISSSLRSSASSADTSPLILPSKGDLGNFSNDTNSFEGLAHSGDVSSSFGCAGLLGLPLGRVLSFLIACFIFVGFAYAQPAEINVTGSGSSIPGDDSNTPSLTDHTDFGSTLVSAGTIVRTFTIENSGNAALVVSAVNILPNDDEFSVTASPSTPVSGSSSTTFDITFNPTGTGTRTAKISIDNSDSDEDPYVFNIQGYGLSDPFFSAGDIAFTMYSATGDDEFAFVALTEIAIGRVIHFMDHGWDNSTNNILGNSEGTVSFTAGVTISAGDQVVIDATGGTATLESTGGSAGTVDDSSDGGFLLNATDGDQILAFEGSVIGGDKVGVSQFLAAIHADAGDWDVSPSTTSESNLPSALTEGTNAVALFASATERDDAVYSGSANLSISALRTSINDDANWTSRDTPAYTISDLSVNDAPVITGLDATSANPFTEDGVAVQLDADVTVSDTELDALNSGSGDYTDATITIARSGGANSDDSFSFGVSGSYPFSDPNISRAAAPAGVIGTFVDDGSGTLTITFTGNTPTTADVYSVLRLVNYENGNNNPPASVDLDVTLDDGAAFGSSVTETIAVNITAVNDAPEIDLNGLSPNTFVPGFGAVIIDPDVTISDAELDALNDYDGATITISRNTSANSDDVFSLATDATYTLSGSTLLDDGTSIGTFVDDAAGTLTISFDNDLKTPESLDVEAVFELVQYSNGNASPPDLVQLDVVLNDGAASNNTVTENITVDIAANDSDIIVDNTLSKATNADPTVYDGTSIDGAGDDELEVARFTLRDGGGSNDFDLVGTVVTDITFNVSNWENLAQIALYDGTGEVGESTVSSGIVAFSSLTITAPDNDTEPLSIWVTFKNDGSVDDNEAIEVTIDVSALVSGNGSSFASGFTGGVDLVDTNSGDENRIEVTGDRLIFNVQPSNAETNIVMTPTVEVTLVDVNGNTDTDNTTGITDVELSSSGTLTGDPVGSSSVSSGVYSFNSLVHTVAGSGLTLTAASTGVVVSGGSPPYTSTAFEVGSPVSESDIVNAAFTAETNFDPTTYDASTIDNTGDDELEIARFTLRDGGGTDSDGFHTEVDGITLNFTSGSANVAQVAIFSGATEIEAGTLTGSSITFNSFTNPLIAADDGTVDFSVFVTFKTDGSVVDGEVVDVEIDVSTLSVAANSSGFDGTFTSGSDLGPTLSGDDNRIEVTGDRLIFNVQPSDIATNGTMSPAVEVTLVDVDGNVDTDNSAGITDVELSSSGTLTGEPVGSSSVSSGVYSFNLLVHTVAGSGLTLTAASTGVVVTGGSPPYTSTTFDVLDPISESDIINTAFTAETNFDPTTYDASTLDNGGDDELEIARFTLRDGGGTDSDGFNTEVDGITLNFTSGSANVAQVAIFAGSTEIEAGTLTGSSITFSSFTNPLIATDDGTVDFSVFVTFKADGSVVDGEVVDVEIDVSTLSVPANSSGFDGTFTSGSDLGPTLAGDDNRIEVTGDRLIFNVQPSNAETNIAMTPTVEVTLVDVDGNTDTDNTAGITDVELSSSGTLTGDPVGSSSVSSGVYSFNSLVHTVAGSGLTLTAASTGVVVSGGSPPYTSTAFEVGSPVSESDIVNAAFTAETNFDPTTYDASTIDNTGDDELEIARFTLRDGGGTDSDGFHTEVDGITLNFASGSANLAQVAIFAGSTEIEAGTLTGSSITFNSFTNPLIAADDGTVDFSVFVTFKADGSVVDGEVVDVEIDVSTLSVAANSSGFDGTFTSGSDLGPTLSGDDNRIEVTGDRLIFNEQPSDIATNGTMSPAVEVTLVDGDGNVDTDNSAGITDVELSSSGTLTGDPVGSSSVSSGVYSFNSLVHTVAGSGLTLTAATTGVVVAGGSPPYTSTTFAVLDPISESDIINAAFTAETNFDPTTYDASTLDNGGDDELEIARFTLRDGGGTDSDLSPTEVDGITLNFASGSANVAQVAIFAGSTEIEAGTLTGSSITFNSFTNPLIATDDGTVDFSVFVTFKADGSVVDGEVVDVEIDVSTLSVAANSSGFDGTFTSGSDLGPTLSGDDNRIEVTGDRLIFNVQPSDIATNGTMSPAVEVTLVDGDGNVDTDNSAGITDVELSSSGTLTGDPVGSSSVSSGVYSFNSLVHTVAGSGLTLTAASTGVVVSGGSPPYTSTTFDVLDPISESDIINAAFTAETNFDPTTYDASTLDNGGDDELEIARFTLRDGGGTDSDLSPTEVDGITLNFASGSANVAQVAIFAGSTEIEAGTLTGSSITFNSFTNPLIATDDGTIDFSVFVTFKADGSVVDGEVVDVEIDVSTLSVAANSSGFDGTFTSGSDLGPTLSGDDNRIEVTATELSFTVDATNTTTNVAMSTVEVSIVDSDSNVDLDNTAGAGSPVEITSNGTLDSSPKSAALTSGVATFTDIVHTATATGRQLTASSTGLSNELSGTFDITGPDSESNIIVDAGLSKQSNFDPTTYTATDIDLGTAGDELQVARFTLQDGGNDITDSDGAATVLSEITFVVTNPDNINKIALYSGGSELAEGTLTAGVVEFTGLSLTAADEGTATLNVYVTFVTDGSVVDGEAIDVTIDVSELVSGTGSGFDSGFTGGADLTDTNSSDENRIDVTATHLAFTTEPVEIGVDTDFTLVVEAQDNNDNTDADFTEDITIEVEDGPGGGDLSASPGSVTATTGNGQLVNGVATFSDLEVDKGGDYVFRGVSASYTNNSGNEAETGTIEALDDLSDIIENQAFIASYPEFINYDQYDDDNLDGSGTDELVIARFEIRDGGEFGDDDNKVTRFHEIDLQFQGGSEAYIHRMAVYTVTDVNGLGSGFEVAEYDVEADGGDTFDFNFRKTSSGGPFSDDFDVPDNSSAIIEVRVSFVKDVDDQAVISLLLVDAEEGGGQSKFTGDLAIPLGGALDGVQAGTNNLTGGDNKIDVVASKLVLTNDASLTGSSPYERNTDNISPTIEAQDVNNNLDLDETSEIAVTGPADFDGAGAITSTFSLTAGTGTAAFTIFSEEEDVVLSFADNDGTAGSRTGTTAIGTGDASSAIDVYDQTAPTVTSRDPADDATGVPLTDELEIVFSEDVAAVAGGHVTVVSDHIPPDVFELDVDNVSEVSITGSTVTITLPAPLRGSARDYYVLVDADAFDDSPNNTDAVDAAALNFAGYLTDNGWEFTTGADNDAPTLTITRNAVTNGSFDNTSDATVSFDLAFSEPMDDATIGLDDVTVTLSGVTVGGSGSGLANSFGSDAILSNDGDDQNYTLTLSTIAITTPGTDGTISITVGPSIDDENGNSMLAAEGPSDAFTIDQSPPTAAITYSDAGPYKDGDIVTITTTFDEDMSDSPVPEIIITGSNSVPATDMTKVSATEYTYDHTVGTGDGTATVSLSTGTDLAGNEITSIPTSGEDFEVDNTAPTAAITYSDAGPYKDGDLVTITATFNEDMSDSPVPQISISGSNTLAADDMMKVSATEYSYDYTVGAGDGTATVSLSTGTDLAGNEITSIPTSGEDFEVDNTAPTAAITYSDAGPYKDGDLVTITATFDEDMSDSPVPQISISGSNTLAADDMMKVSATEYSYDYTVGVGNGTATVSLSTGTDLAGNEITSIPTSGEDFEVDNTAPTAAITYSDAGPYKDGDLVTITATFNEDMSDSPVPQISISGSNTLAADDMMKVSATEYSYDYTVGAGNGTATVSLSTGTDLAGNEITSIPTSGEDFEVDNTAPTAAITYSDAGPYKDGDIVTITATFNEDMSDSPVPEITITGSNSVPATDMTKVSATEYTYDHTVGTGDGTATVSLSTGTDLAGNEITSIPTSGEDFEVDNTAPTAAITYSDAGPYKDGDLVTITATFNEDMSDSPVPQISISGSNTLAADDMMKVSATEYSYDYTVGAGDGTATVSLSTGTDLAGNEITSIPTSGEDFEVDNTAPTAAITYSDAGPYKDGDLVTITATFDEDMSDSPVPQISISGSNTLAADDMMKVSATEYSYDYTVGVGNGTATVSLSTGTDLAGNEITSIPTSGEDFEVDNTAPTAAITYSDAGPYKDGDLVTITATFNEDMSDSPVPQISISGSNTLAADDMMKVSATEYSYDYTVGAGNGTATVSLSTGTDLAGNEITSIPTSGEDFEVDNTPPTLESMTIASGVAPTDHATTGELVTLTMDFDDDLSSAPTVDFTSGSAAINGAVTVTETDAVNDIWTASFTVSALDTDGDIDFTLDFTDDAGNAGATADNTDLDGGASSTVEVDQTVPTVESLEIISDNTTDDQHGVTTDVVTITIDFDDDLLSAPTPTILSGGVGITDGSPTVTETDAVNEIWEISYIVDAGDTEGAVTFSIAFTDDAGNAGVAVTESDITNGSSIEIDFTPPTRETLAIISDNATDDQHGVATDVVTITIDFDDDLSAAPVPTILSGGVGITDGSPTVTETDAVNEVWEISYVVDGGDTEGAVTFSIAFTDDAGNTGTAITEAEITDGSSIEIDHTPPTLESMTIASGVAPTDHATTGELVTLTMDFDDDLSSAPTVDFTSGSAAINGAVTVTETDAVNDIWTASFTVSALDTDGDIDFTLDFTDDAGNAGATADNTDLDGGASSTVEVDQTVPTVESLEIISDNTTDDQHGVATDVVTITIDFDDDLLSAPTPTILSGGVGITDGSPTVTETDAVNEIWEISYIVDAGDTEGAVTFSIAFTDDAGNAGVAVTESDITNGSLIEIDFTPPTRETLAIISDNATDDQHGVATDVVTITIDFDDDLSAAPVPTILSGGVGITDGSPTVTETDAVNEVWEISYVVDGGDTEGAVTFSIAFTDDAGNTGTAITEAEITDGSSMEIDHTPPTLESMTIASGVAPTDHATTGELVTLTMDFDDDLSSAPTVDFTSGSAAINGAVTVTETDAVNDIWTASFTVSALDTDGDIDFTLDFTDDAGNAGATADNTDLDGGAASTVEVDNTAPTVLSASIDTDNGIDDQQATDLDVVTLTFTVDDDLLTDPTVTFSSGGTAVQGSVTINNASAPTYTATYTVDGNGTIVGTDLDAEGAVTFTIDFDDDAGNSATTVTSVTDGTEVEVDFTPATLQSAVQDSDTQITVTFSEVVETNGTNPTDFTVTDANTPSVNYVVSAQADGIADDAEIVLTVADLSGVIGDLLVSYTDNSGEIYDLAGVSAATSGPVTIDRAMTGIVSLSEDATDVANGDTNGDDLAMYRTNAGNDPSPLTPVTITPSISGSTITIYDDEGLTSVVQTYNNVTTDVSPTVADLVGIDFGDGTADHGVYTFYITETAVNGSSSEGPEVEYSIAFLDDISLSPSELVFSGENSSGTELSLDNHPATGQNLTFSGDGLTDFDINPGATSSARFVPIAAGVGTTSIDVIWENDATGVEAAFTSVVNFTVNATTEVFVGQATNLGKSEGNQFLNVNSSPDAIDVGEDLSDGSDPDFYSLEVYYVENGAVKTDIPGDAPGALRPDGNLANLLLAYDSDNNRPPITAGVPTFTEDEWEFDPSAFTALGVSGAQEVDTLLFIYVVSSDDGATLVENAFANIRLYPNPEIAIQGVDDYYCNSDDEFPILLDLFTYDGDGGVDLNDVAISNGYKLLYKQASADPYVQIADSTATGSVIVNTFDPSQVASINGGNDIGFYRIEYTTDPQTAASTTSTTTFDFQVLGHAAEPSIVSNLDSIGSFDAIGYLLEYSVGQDLGTLTSSGASITWLDQIDQEISSGNTIDVRDDVFGIDPAIRTSRTIKFFDNNLIDNAGVPTVNFDGCASENVLVDIEIYPIPDAPVVLVADNVNEEDVSTATQNSFLFEYCEDDLIADMTFDNDVSDSRAHFTVYDANLNRVLDSAFVTLNWSQHIFGNETPRDTIIFIATVTEDSIFAGGGNTAFPGSTSDTSKIELRVHDVPVSILDMVTTQGKDLFFTEYFTCEGDDFAPIDAPEVLDPAGVKNDTLFFWYLDDGDLTFAGTPFVFGGGGDEFLQESPSLTTGDLEGFTTTYQDPSGGAMTTAEFDINVPGTYYVWVTEAVQQSEDSDFPGCQSEPTLVSITVFPDALEATIDSKTVSPNNSNDVDYEYFFCASDLDASVTFEAALNGFANAAFSTNASIVAADTMAANVISEFNWYNSNAEGAQQTQRFTGATASAVDLGLITSVDDTVYIYLEQVTNIVTDANGDRIYSGCEAPGVVIQFTIFREPDAPVVDEPIYYYCEGDVIDDLSVATEANAFVTWSVDGSATTFSNQASDEGDGTGIAIATMADLGIGQNPPADSTYTINVVQRMDETAGSAVPPESEAFVGCTSEATQIRVLVRANPDLVTITTSLACSDGQLVDIQFSGDQLANSFYIYPTDVQERSLRRDTLGGNAEQFSFELLGYEEGMDTIIYMSQIVATDLDPDFDGCESELTPIPIYAAPRLGDFGGGNGLINDPRACNDVRLLEVQVTNLGEDVFEDFDFQWTVSSELRTEETEISTSSPISGGAEIYSITMEETIQDLALPVTVVVEDTKNGCQSTAVRNIGIGNTPDPQFSLFNITENNNTSYVFDDFEITDNNEIERLTFELRQGSATLNIFERIQEPGVDILDTLETAGLNAGAYSGVLTLRSVNGCEASKERPFDILQKLAILPGNSRVYDFNLVDADGWRIETQNGFADRNQGWEVAEPAGENIVDDPDGRGTRVWVTNADGRYSEDSDQSFVYSPSYDFSEVVRPAVTFDYFKNLVNASDGVVFQWSADDGRSWRPLGGFDDQNGTSGLLWFDRAGISGNPGVFEENPNQVGWADTDSLQWKEAVHSLGVIPQQDRDNIRFRFALGVRPGDAADKADGFAFDNFRIFGRDRVTILETFSSTLDESSLTSNEEVYSSIDGNEEIIWVNYFTDLANDLNARDEINAINRADPEARLAFYGISKVPTAALSGEVQVQEPNETSIGDLGFNENDLGRTSLVVPLFDVELTANAVSADLLEITATATAKPDNGTDLESETSVRVMILQNEVSSEFVENVSQEYTFRNRLVEILPSSVGEVIVGEIEAEQEIFNQTLEWEVRNLLGAANTEIELTVLVFVQDEISKGVYQAASAQVTVTLPETVTGILPGVISADTYSVYPNPGDQQFTIRMDQVMTEDTNWSIADYSGKEVLSGQMKRGINETVVNIENLANGVYLLKLHNNANTWELKKLMVLRR